MAVNSGRCKNWRGNQYTLHHFVPVFYLWQWRLHNLFHSQYSNQKRPNSRSQYRSIQIERAGYQHRLHWFSGVSGKSFGTCERTFNSWGSNYLPFLLWKKHYQNEIVESTTGCPIWTNWYHGRCNLLIGAVDILRTQELMLWLPHLWF